MIQMSKTNPSFFKDNALKEKEDSNSVLRRDLMESMAKFGLEKVQQIKEFISWGNNVSQNLFTTFD